MSRITLIEPQKRDKSRCSIYIDGRFYCGIKLEVAMKYRLKTDMEIDEQTLDKIQLETEKSQAVDKAMTHLSATMKTKKQIVDFLASKGYTQTVIDYVLGKLEYYNLVNDYEYCRAYINSVSGKGKTAIRADLMKRGADAHAIDEVLSDFEEDGDGAYEVFKKYMRGKETSKNNLYKAVRYLMSKGYSYDTAKAVLERAGGADDEDY